MVPGSCVRSERSHEMRDTESKRLVVRERRACELEKVADGGRRRSGEKGFDGRTRFRRRCHCACVGGMDPPGRARRRVRRRGSRLCRCVWRTRHSSQLSACRPEPRVAVAESWRSGWPGLPRRVANGRMGGFGCVSAAFRRSEQCFTMITHDDRAPYVVSESPTRLEVPESGPSRGAGRAAN